MLSNWELFRKSLNWLNSFISSLLLILFSRPVLSQTLPEQLDEDFRNQKVPLPITPTPPEKPLKIPEAIPKIPLNLPNNSDEEKNLQIPGTIRVKEFKFEGNTVFSDRVLKELVKDYLNRPISFVELLQVEEIIKNKYTNSCYIESKIELCYINSGAYIPYNQVLNRDKAIVIVRVVEGGVESLEISGTDKLNTSYVRSRILKGVAIPLNRDELLERLQLLQLDPLITNLSAELSDGSSLDRSILSVSIKEANSSNIELFTDNGRATSVGSWRRGIRISEGNLLGWGDKLFGEYINTEGSNAIDLSYSFPLNADNTTFTISGGVTNTEVIEEPFDRLEIEGDSFNLEFDLRDSLLRTPSKEFAIGLSTSRQESNSEVLGRNFALSPGADENGETRISAIRFYQEYTNRNLQQVVAFRSQFSLGINAFDATVNNNDLPDSRFFAWRGQGQYVRRLGMNGLAILRSDLQLSVTNLVPLEQFSSGGLRSVRGYRQDALLTDNGLFLSGEVRLPIVKINKIDGVLQVAPFIDFGVAWNDEKNESLSENTLASIGLGLQWQMGDKFTARFDYGVPLNDLEDSEGSLQEDGLYFSVNYSLF